MLERKLKMLYLSAMNNSIMCKFSETILVVQHNISNSKTTRTANKLACSDTNINTSDSQDLHI